MNDWVDSTVGGVTEYQRAGGTPLATVPHFYGGEISFVTIEDITRSGRYLDRTDRTLSATGLRGSAAWLLKDEHVLYSMYATVGKPIINRISCATNQAIIALKPAANIDLKFLYYQLLFVRPDVYKYTAQTTQSNLNARVVREIPIRYPRSRADQAQIVKVLDCLDDAIEQTEALIEKHQQIKAGLMHDLFTCGVLPGGLLRPPPSAAPGSYQSSVLGPLPRHWSASTLRSCLSEGASNGIYKPPHLIGRGTLLIGQTALTEDRSVDPRLARRATVSSQDLRRFGLAAGDILIARVFATVEGVGRPALLPELGEPAVFESNMMRLRVNSSTIRPRLLFEWLKADVSRRHIAGRANASNQVSVNQGVLYPLPVPVPPLDEQDRMLVRIDAADARRAADLATLSQLRAQKLGLMQDLLTGKVRVPERTAAAVHA